MVLVSYSDSDSDSDADGSQPEVQRPTIPSTTQPSKKRKIEATPTPATSTTKQPPPLPPSFHSLYATNVRTSTTDDPSLHGGRKRQVVHVQGNWPSHVFLEWLPDRPQLQALDELIQHARRAVVANSGLSDHDFKFNTFLRSTLSAQLPLHVSLSAPLVLSTSDKDEFRGALVDAVGTARIGEVSVQLVALDLVPNFEKSRWFLVLRLGETGSGKLTTLLKLCNGVCGGFGLPLLYQGSDVVGVDTAKGDTGYGGKRVKRNKASGDGELNISSEARGESQRDMTDAFHISIAWALEEVPEDARSAVQRMGLGSLGAATVRFDRLKIKIGNVVDDVQL